MLITENKNVFVFTFIFLLVHNEIYPLYIPFTFLIHVIPSFYKDRYSDSYQLFSLLTPNPRHSFLLENYDECSMASYFL